MFLHTWLQIQTELGISTICQRLFYQGNELLENLATATSLQLLANDSIDLQEVNEGSDIDDGPRKKQRDEGNGFGGTILGGAASQRPVVADVPTLQVDDAVLGKACPACTFVNTFEVLGCIVCDTLFM